MTQVHVPSMTSRPRSVGALHDVGADAVGADHDGGAVIDFVERVDGLDAERLEVADDALVVDDLAEGMRRLAGGRGLLGLVDRLAHPVAESGALRDPDFFDHSHGPIIARGLRRAPPAYVAARRLVGRRRVRIAVRAALAGGRSPAMRRMMRSSRGPWRPADRARRELVGEAERACRCGP